MRKLGIDVGSSHLSAVVLEGDVVRSRWYAEHRGEVAAAVRSVLSLRDFSRWDCAGVTGVGSAAIDPMLAAVEGARFLLPESRNILALGGQSYALILLDKEGLYREHSTNPPCASGTGSFLEQQAERLGVGVQELSERAARFSGAAPKIATRCAVFAKTDITHAMQEGYSLDAICAGLAEGIARSVLDTLLKGRRLSEPVGIIGGVSLNAKIARTIGQLLGLRVLVPENSHLAGAVGAALLGSETRLDPDALVPGRTQRPTRPRLSCSGAPVQTTRTDGDVESFFADEKPRNDDAFLGIDIGSTSTKAVLIDTSARIIGGFYTRTKGDPLGAVQKLLTSIAGAYKGEPPRVLGAATTGSGRKMIHRVLADAEINEITAHAKAAVFLYPDVDTIIEIGGQDSKFTRIAAGEVYYSNMNYVCAAGTGSFIEEQAHRLGVDLDRFAELALQEPAPLTSDRCTVYMERDLTGLLSEGWSQGALAAAVLHSVRDNYLSKVAGKSALGDRIVFQGATARNRALVAAFEQFLGKTIHVSPYCHLTGALGAALSCRETGITSSRFSWEMSRIDVSVEECELCANHCRLTVVSRGAESSVAWGMKCGREYAERSPRRAAQQTRLSEVEKRFAAYCAAGAASSPPKIRRQATIGVATSLYNADYAPMWKGFLSRLGFGVVTTQPLRDAAEYGASVVNSEFCAPMILAHGYVKQLLDGGVDYVFCPAVTNEREGAGPDATTFRKKEADSAYCYYSQYLPSVVSKLTTLPLEDKLIAPLLPLREKSDEDIAAALHAEIARRFPDVTEEETREAFRGAHAQFRETQNARGSALCPSGADSADKPLRIVLMGRPYVVFDSTLNLSLPATLEEMGASVFWQDELDADSAPLTYANRFLERMHWQYGRKIIRAAEFIARTENLYPVFLTCFRCSPDSFLMTYLKDIFTHFGKPFLFLQLDLHASDVGYTTRIEAAWETFRHHRSVARVPSRSEAQSHARNDALEQGDTVLISSVDPLIGRFWADSFARAGYVPRVLEPSESALNTGYRYASGGECMPLVSIVGAAIEAMREKGVNRRKAYFFLPTIPMSCNMPQFPIFADMAFRAAGLGEIKSGLINFMSLGDSLQQTLSVKLLECYLVGCILHKLGNRVRPYERVPGSANRALHVGADAISAAIRGGTDTRAALTRAAEAFRAVQRDETDGRKPRVALLGDLYVKYNPAANQNLPALIERLGCEIVISSMSEYPAHFFDIGVKRYGEDPRSGRILRTIELRFEKMVEDLIGDQAEPDFAECAALTQEYGLRHDIAGETSINVGRALWYCRHEKVQAIVHVNPMFCCPGVVSASIYRKMQEDFGIPIIDIFYDGTGDPNRVLIPHLYYLRSRLARR